MFSSIRNTIPLYLCLTALAYSPAVAQKLTEKLGKPDIVVASAGMPREQQTMLMSTAREFYEFWNTNNAQALKAVISPYFIDRNLPKGRPQGPSGPLYANTQFHTAVPDLRQLAPGR